MLEKTKNIFQKEQDALLQTVLGLRFLDPWTDKEYDDFSLVADANLEIFITSACNQKCEYCYLIKHKDLYPQEFRDKSLILDNLRKLYDWIYDNNYHIPLCTFFSGEIWHINFGLEVLDITLEYLKKGINIDRFMIPSNCSFVLDESQLEKIQTYIDLFDKYGYPLQFSISVDGAILESETRPLNNGIAKTEDYYDRLFLFAKHNNYYFHPMVSAFSVEKWIENYKWWEKQFNKWDMNISALMMLEVRNDDWTEEKITAYTSFLNFLIDKYFEEECGKNVEVFSNRLMNIRNYIPQKIHPAELAGYTPWALPETDSFIGCTCANELTVRLGDLAIIPCHRLGYNKYKYGNFTLKNNHIDTIEANNPQMAVKILMSNFNLASFGCDTCLFNHYCLKGCYGSQYENMGDPFIPVPNICNFFKKKYSFLLQKYKDMGVFDYYKTIAPQELEYPRIKKLLDLFEEWEVSPLCNG